MSEEGEVAVGHVAVLGAEQKASHHRRPRVTVEDHCKRASHDATVKIPLWIRFVMRISTKIECFFRGVATGVYLYIYTPPKSVYLKNFYMVVLL